MGPNADPYSQSFPGMQELKLTGKGNFDPLPFLSDDLALPFLEPDCICHGASAPPGEYPDVAREDYSSSVDLAWLWDRQDLLRLHAGPAPVGDEKEFVRVFNCFKSPGVARMIGDRRGRNYSELPLRGPSSGLPTGVHLLGLIAKPSQYLAVSVTDRKDFYTQLRVGARKAMKNCLYPPLRTADLVGTQALCKLLREGPNRVRARDCDRRSLLVPPVDAEGPRVFALFEAIFQGDHSRVEVATCKCLDSARSAYAESGLLGSTEKDLQEVCLGKVGGAELDSSPWRDRSALSLLGRRGPKRLSLAAVSLVLAASPCTTDCLHLCLMGGWTSILLYRRPLMAVLVKGAEVRSGSPNVIPLPRSVADELVVVSALAPLAVSDLSAQLLPEVFATDSSEDAAASVQAPCDPDVLRALWLSADRRGGYSRMLSKAEALLKSHDPDFEELGDRFGNEASGLAVRSHAERPRSLRFHCLEVGVRVGAISDDLRSLGWVPGPALGFEASPEYDLKSCHLVGWISHLLERGLLDSLVIRPPVSDFSVHRRPATRTFARPQGREREGERALDHRRAESSLFLFRHAVLVGVPAVLLQPGSSVMPRLPAWRTTMSRDGVVQQVWGKRHWVALLCNLALSDGPNSFDPECPEQAAYSHLARCLDSSLRKRFAALACSDLCVEGLETPLANHIALSSKWSVRDVWAWPRPVHINILESSTVYRLLRSIALETISARIVSLLDSNVSRCALSKGRSSAKGLFQVLWRTAALEVGFGLYPAYPFCPTRWMPADGPSRDGSPPLAVPGLDCAWTSGERLIDLQRLPRLRRWASNWVRLVLRLSSPASPVLRHDRRFASFAARTFFGSGMDFDATLGYPGEGPALFSFRVFRVWVFISFILLSHGMLQPRNLADRLRKTARQDLPLPLGRPVEKHTQRVRDRLWDEFAAWLRGNGLDLEAVFGEGAIDIDFVNIVLGKYGRELYQAGRPYSHCSETINAASSLHPKIRRLLQPAWDVAFSWMRNETHHHHVAMPWQVLLAMISIALYWGWPLFAGCMALTWGGLARAGEVFQAYRHCLFLPSDVRLTTQWVILAIPEPKTRYKAARHQSLKVDHPDLIEVIEFAFSGLSPGQKLWPMSDQSFRNRFQRILAALHLQSLPRPFTKTLDLGSMRAGGATWLMMVSEDSELVRRRGRWLTSKIMEIYIQEVSALQFLPALPKADRDYLLDWAGMYSYIFARVRSLKGTPPHMWQIFLGRGA
ncbi:unnamed protein product [Symbiodinium sp. CCMP2592]|nr:unnamed protein product [Symbiodinium sp. CCMP2592]